METIVTPVTVITLDSTKITHSIKADLVARYFPPVVRLVQYDMSLPVIAVSLMQNGQAYTLPSGAAANIRVHKPDATYIYNPALGCDSTRNIVYFEVTQAMAAANGDGLAIVEIVVDGDIAGTSLITLHFEENPVPEDAIESSDEWETIYELGERIIASTVTPVSTAAGMTDHNVVYLYTGTESGWNQGHMYYYNGTTWVDAGIAVTDTTLSVSGLAADAKATGDRFDSLDAGDIEYDDSETYSSGTVGSELSDLMDDLQAVEDDVTDLKSELNATMNALATDTASGAIASFPDGADGVPVKDLTVAIEPAQDLHGQSNPYPAGGGKNLFRVNVNSQTLNGVTFSVNSDGTIVANGTASANFALVLNTTSLPSGSYIISKGFASTTLLLNIYDNDAHSNLASVGNTEVTFTSTGQSINVLLYCYSGTNYSNVKIYPMIRLSSVSDATFAPYSNICPISGWTGANVGKMGKNLAGLDFVGAYNTTTGEKNPVSSSSYASTAKFKIRPSTSYVCSAGFTITQLLVWYWAESGDFLRFVAVNSGTVFTTPSDAVWCAVSFRKGSDGSSLSDFPNTQVEVGSTVTAYEPYNGETIAVDWTTEAGTVYGGSLDVTTGGMTVDRGEVDLGTLTWDYNSNTSIFSAAVTGIVVPASSSDRDKGIVSSIYPVSTNKSISASMDDKSMLTGSGYIYIRDTSYSSAASFKTAMSGQTLVYELAEPLTVQLTANEISTLLGQNNIWADTGNTEVEYRADTKLYIDKKIASLS